MFYTLNQVRQDMLSDISLLDFECIPNNIIFQFARAYTRTRTGTEAKETHSGCPKLQGTMRQAFEGMSSKMSGQ